MMDSPTMDSAKLMDGAKLMEAIQRKIDNLQPPEPVAPTEPGTIAPFPITVAQLGPEETQPADYAEEVAPPSPQDERAAEIEPRFPMGKQPSAMAFRVSDMIRDKYTTTGLKGLEDQPAPVLASLLRSVAADLVEDAIPIKMPAPTAMQELRTACGEVIDLRNLPKLSTAVDKLINSNPGTLVLDEARLLLHGVLVHPSVAGQNGAALMLLRTSIFKAQETIVRALGDSTCEQYAKAYGAGEPRHLYIGRATTTRTWPGASAKVWWNMSESAVPMVDHSEDIHNAAVGVSLPRAAKKVLKRWHDDKFAMIIGTYAPVGRADDGVIQTNVRTLLQAALTAQACPWKDMPSGIPTCTIATCRDQETEVEETLNKQAEVFPNGDMIIVYFGERTPHHFSAGLLSWTTAPRTGT